MTETRRPNGLGEVQRNVEGIKGIGVTDWNLGPTDSGLYEATPRSLLVAKKIGFASVQVSLGWDDKREELKLANPALQTAFRVTSTETGVALSSLRLDRLQVDNPASFDLREQERAYQLLQDTLPIAQSLGASPENKKVVLLPFFGSKKIKDRETGIDHTDRVAEVLAEIAPKAKSAGVVYALENTLTAEENQELLKKAGNAEALGVYYDVGNARKWNFSIKNEIIQLNEEGFLAEIHFKDNTIKDGELDPKYLDEKRGGRINYREVVDTLVSVGYNGWVILEAMSPREGDMKKTLEERIKNDQPVIEADLLENLTYTRSLIAA